MYEVQLEGRKAVKHADHIRKRLIPVLELKKTPMTVAAENVTNNGSTVVEPELSVNDYPTGKNNGSTAVEPEMSVNDYPTGKNKGSTVVEPEVSVNDKEINQPRRSSRLAKKPKRTYA